MGVKAEVLGVGVIGAGIMGTQHAQVFSQLPQTKLLGVADVNAQRAQKLAEKYGTKWYTDYTELLAQKDIQAVSVATPDHLHFKVVADALEAGKHVLVEKPLATNIEEARALVKIAEESKLKLMVNYNNRWGVVYQTAKSLIEKGEIGIPLMAYAMKHDAITVPTQMLSWSKHTSCVHFLSTHDIDMVRWYFGEPDATEVYAVACERVLKKKGITTLDVVQAIVKFENGAVATFESGWIHPSQYPTLTESQLHVIGEHGVLHIDRREENLFVCTDVRVFLPRTSLGGELDGYLRSSFAWAVEHFVRAVLEDRRPLTDGVAGLKAVEIAVAIHLSIEEGRPIKLPL